LCVGTIGIQPLYFLDEMSASEVDAIITAYNNTYKNTWEQFRYVAFINAAVNSDKINKPQDLLKFSWEADEKPALTKEEKLKLEKEMLEWLSKITV
jgi:hypothetical protein